MGETFKGGGGEGGRGGANKTLTHWCSIYCSPLCHLMIVWTIENGCRTLAPNISIAVGWLWLHHCSLCGQRIISLLWTLSLFSTHETVGRDSDNHHSNSLTYSFSYCAVDREVAGKLCQPEYKAISPAVQGFLHLAHMGELHTFSCHHHGSRLFLPPLRRMKSVNRGRDNGY